MNKSNENIEVIEPITIKPNQHMSKRAKLFNLSDNVQAFLKRSTEDENPILEIEFLTEFEKVLIGVKITHHYTNCDVRDEDFEKQQTEQLKNMWNAIVKEALTPELLIN